MLQRVSVKRFSFIHPYTNTTFNSWTKEANAYFSMQAQRALSASFTFSGICRVRHASHSSIKVRRVPCIAKTANSHSSKSYVGFDLQRPLPSSYPPQLSKPDQSSRKSAKLSLFAELFPEEDYKKAASAASAASRPLKQDVNLTVPPLSLPTVEELLEGFGIQSSSDLPHPKEATKAASNDAYKHRKTAVLVLQCASKSLVESDFRRIAPKGMHIDGWTGPGDILTGMS